MKVFSKMTTKSKVWQLDLSARHDCAYNGGICHKTGQNQGQEVEHTIDFPLYVYSKKPIAGNNLVKTDLRLTPHFVLGHKKSKFCCNSYS